MVGVGKPNLRPSLISFIGQILKIRFGDVNSFGFQILKGYSSYQKPSFKSRIHNISYSLEHLSEGRSHKNQVIGIALNLMG